MSKKILISAGHSTVAPVDSGAVGSGYVEAREALRVRDAVAEKLRAMGAIVIEDGSDGISEPLRKAIALARSADIAVEIHFNGSANPKASGIEVLAKSKHTRFAQKLSLAINEATGIGLRGNAGYKSDSSGQHHRLGFCEAGGLIVEICFISNPSDMKRYNDNFGQLTLKLALVIAAEAGIKTTDACSKPNTQVIYEVQKGDTLFSIARKFSAGLSFLLSKNNLTSDTIEIGQKLIVKD